MIYIDPPYNTGNDFIYNDDFTENEEEYKEKCPNNEVRSLTDSGINAEQMILYIMT